MSGNLCRCGAYAGILAAVRESAGRPGMRELTYLRPDDAAAAVAAVSGDPEARFLAGGTNLVDHLKLGVARPGTLVDVSRLPMDGDRGARRRDGSRPGCGSAPTCATATSPPTRGCASASRWCPARCSPAPPASCATRPPPAATCCSAPAASTSRTSPRPCNKREPGTGCSARRRLRPLQRGARAPAPTCVATHPSDLAVALAALDATRRGARTGRRAPASRSPSCTGCPGDRPSDDTTLRHGELITAVELPDSARRPSVGATTRPATARRTPSRWSPWPPPSTSRTTARSATSGSRWGGVAHKPWRATRAEEALRGRVPDEEAVRAAARAELADAVTDDQTAYKTTMVEGATRARARPAAPGRPAMTPPLEVSTTPVTPAEIGRDLERADGVEKVTGRATYADRARARRRAARLAGHQHRRPWPGHGDRPRPRPWRTPEWSRCSTTPTRPGSHDDRQRRAGDPPGRRGRLPRPDRRGRARRDLRGRPGGRRAWCDVTYASEPHEAELREDNADHRARGGQPRAAHRHRRGRRRRSARGRRRGRRARPTARRTSPTTRSSRTPSSPGGRRTGGRAGAHPARLHPGRARRGRGPRPDARTGGRAAAGGGAVRRRRVRQQGRAAQPRDGRRTGRPDGARPRGAAGGDPAADVRADRLPHRDHLAHAPGRARRRHPHRHRAPTPSSRPPGSASTPSRPPPPPG